jgi:hypothetical protein
MRRWKWVAPLGVLVATVGVHALWPRFDPPHPVTSISRETFRRIKPAMTQAEVTKILGTPGMYWTRDTEPDDSLAESGETISTSRPATFASTVVWWTDTAVVIVAFDKAGTVTFAEFSPARSSTKTTWQKLRDRAGRLWREWFP